MTGFFIVFVAISPIVLALLALRVGNPIRALQRIAEAHTDEATRDWDTLAERIARKEHPFN